MIYELNELRFLVTLRFHNVVLPLRAVQVLEPVAASVQIHALDHVQEHSHHPQVPRSVGKLEHGEELVALALHVPTHLAPIEERKGEGERSDLEEQQSGDELHGGSLKM